MDNMEHSQDLLLELLVCLLDQRGTSPAGEQNISR